MSFPQIFHYNTHKEKESRDLLIIAQQLFQTIKSFTSNYFCCVLIRTISVHTKARRLSSTDFIQE